MAVSEAQKKATAEYEAKKYDKILTRFPKNTKELIKATGAISVNSFIVNAVKNELLKYGITLETTKESKNKMEQIIQEDVKQIAKDIDNELIAAGLPELDPAKKAEIKAKLDAKIAETEAKKAAKDQNAPRKDSFFEKLEQLKKDNSEGKLALNVREVENE